jgi:hypothetical protein
MIFPDAHKNDANREHSLTQDLIAKKREQISLYAGYITTLQEITRSENLLSEISRQINAMNDIWWTVNSKEMNTNSWYFKHMLTQELNYSSSDRKPILLALYKKRLLNNLRDKIQTLTIISSFLKDEIEKLERQL